MPPPLAWLRQASAGVLVEITPTFGGKILEDTHPTGFFAVVNNHHKRSYINRRRTRKPSLVSNQAPRHYGSDSPNFNVVVEHNLQLAT